MDFRRKFVREFFLAPKVILGMVFGTLLVWGLNGLLFLKAVSKLELDLQYWPIYVFSWFLISLAGTVSIFFSVRKMLIKMAEEYQEAIDEVEVEKP